MSNDILMIENISTDYAHLDNELTIHYHIRDGLHIMDAKIHNISEANILSIIEIVSETLGLNIHIDILARNEGGIKDIILFRPKTAKDKLLFTSIYAPIFVSFIIFLISYFLTKNPELEELQIQAYKAQIDALAIQEQQVIEKDEKDKQVLDLLKKIDEKLPELNKGEVVRKIRRKQSTIYKQLNEDKNVTAFSIEKISNEEIIEVGRVNKCEFSNFVIETPEQIVELDEDATIEIVSPVLNNSNIKWKGIYNEEIIDFYMKDKEFKQQILNNNLQFGSNNILSAILEIKKKINERGEEEPSSYSVTAVLGTELKDGYIETAKGKRYREDPRQLSLFVFDDKQ